MAEVHHLLTLLRFNDSVVFVENIVGVNSVEVKTEADDITEYSHDDQLTV